MVQTFCAVSLLTAFWCSNRLLHGEAGDDVPHSQETAVFLLWVVNLHWFWRKAAASTRLGFDTHLLWKWNELRWKSQFRHRQKGGTEAQPGAGGDSVWAVILQHRDTRQEMMLVMVRRLLQFCLCSEPSLVLKKGCLLRARPGYTPLVEVNQAINAWSF